jgi:DNA-binding transcriptional regulator YbjK
MSPPAPPRTAPAPPNRPSTVRSRLLESALEILGEEGMHALTQTRVAEHAGLRQSHLTYYFPTRSDLLKGIVEHAASISPGMFATGAASLEPTLASLKEHLGDQVTDTRLSRVMLALTAASDEDPSLKRWMVEFDRSVREMFGATLAAMGRRVKTQDLALFHATMVGVAVLHSSEGTATSAAEARKLVGLALDRLVDGPPALHRKP